MNREHSGRFHVLEIGQALCAFAVLSGDVSYMCLNQVLCWLCFTDT